MRRRRHRFKKFFRSFGKKVGRFRRSFGRLSSRRRRVKRGTSFRSRGGILRSQ